MESNGAGEGRREAEAEKESSLCVCSRAETRCSPHGHMIRWECYSGRHSRALCPGGPAGCLQGTVHIGERALLIGRRCVFLQMALYHRHTVGLGPSGLADEIPNRPRRYKTETTRGVVESRQGIPASVPSPCGTDLGEETTVVSGQNHVHHVLHPLQT